MSTLKKEIKFYSGDVRPPESGWYYCLVKSGNLGFYDVLLKYDSIYDEWSVYQEDIDEVIYWMYPLSSVLYFDCPWAEQYASKEYHEKMERRRQEDDSN